jgi:hypothetical protein
MRVFNKQVATAVPMNANYNSPYVPLKSIYTYTVSAVITGTPTGVIAIQVSNDPETNDTQINSTGLPPAQGPVNWVTITNSPFTVTSSGIEMWNVNFVGYNYVRVTYTDNSAGASTATMNIVFNGKGV